MPKRRKPLVSWFNFELFEQVLAQLIKEKKDLKIFSENLGTTYDTVWRIRGERREPIFSVVAKLVELTKIPFERWVKIPNDKSFVNMDQQKRGRKFMNAATVKTITRIRKTIKKEPKKKEPKK